MPHARSCQRQRKGMSQSRRNSSGLERERLPLVPDSTQQQLRLGYCKNTGLKAPLNPILGFMAPKRETLEELGLRKRKEGHVISWERELGQCTRVLLRCVVGEEYAQTWWRFHGGLWLLRSTLTYHLDLVEVHIYWGAHSHTTWTSMRASFTTGTLR